MKPSVRDRMRTAVLHIEKLETMYRIECAKSSGLERLLAEHHGTDVLTEEQVRLCVTCSPLLEK